CSNPSRAEELSSLLLWCPSVPGPSSRSALIWGLVEKQKEDPPGRVRPCLSTERLFWSFCFVPASTLVTWCVYLKRCCVGAKTIRSKWARLQLLVMGGTDREGERGRL